jgi:hypothetical protein
MQQCAGLRLRFASWRVAQRAVIAGCKGRPASLSHSSAHSTFSSPTSDVAHTSVRRYGMPMM